MADIKLVKADILYDDSLELLRNIISSINKSFNVENIKSVDALKIQFPFETIDTLALNINKYIEYPYDGNDANFINGLIWIYLESNQKFIQNIELFNRIYNDFEKKHGGINPLCSLEYDDDFEKMIIEMTEFKSIHEYRDAFYDAFGIDLIEYFDIIINPELKHQRSYPHYILKNISTKFYPYKSKKIAYNLHTEKPIHKLIKLYTCYMEISPFSEVNDIKKSAMNHLSKMKKDVQALNPLFDLYYENEENTQTSISNKFKSVQKSKDAFKRAFIVLNIIKLHNLEDEFDKAVRLFNFYMLQKYYDQIYIGESNLLQKLQEVDGFEKIEGAMKIHDDIPLNVILDGPPKENIKKIVKLLLQELP